MVEHTKQKQANGSRSRKVAKAGRLRVQRISPRAVKFFRGDILAWLNSVSSTPGS
jgi:hypothetical protein